MKEKKLGEKKKNENPILDVLLLACLLNAYLSPLDAQHRRFAQNVLG